MQLHSGRALASRSAGSSRLSGGSGSGGGGVAGAAAAAARQHAHRQRRTAAVRVRAAQAESNDFGESVKRIAKRIQGSLPIVGLLSRLASPEGGFDEIAYPEFCRTVYDTATPSYFDAVRALEAAHGKPAAHRALLMVLWMAKHGVGIVAAKDVVAAARRVRVSHDIEVEVDRFEGAREAFLRKYSLMERPQAKLGEQLEVAVDGLAALALGLPDGREVPSEDAPRIAALVSFIFPAASQAQVAEAVAARPQRTYS